MYAIELKLLKNDPYVVCLYDQVDAAYFYAVR